MSEKEREEKEKKIIADAIADETITIEQLFFEVDKKRKEVKKRHAKTALIIKYIDVLKEIILCKAEAQIQKRYANDSQSEINVIYSKN